MSEWKPVLLLVATFPLWVPANILGLTLGVVWGAFRDGWEEGSADE